MNEDELSKAYEPLEVEGRWYPVWMERGYFRAEARSDKPPFCIVLPPPNVTGSLHLGHALTATLQDILVRWHRMRGDNALWVPGTDHAGIATQMVVERELRRTEKKSRHDLGREAFVKRAWEWKERYGSRIAEQHRVLGASLDWSRERFTLDEGASAAVREVFVRLHEEGLIYRAQKLINWCPSCHTALSDLEVEHQEREGSLWHLRYPVKGSIRMLTVATTRPETLLGDTAVAVHPADPRYRELIGQTVILPLSGREIPIIGDAELVDPAFGSGVVKVTPGHDFNDYQTGLRHGLPMISLLDESGRTNKEAGAYANLDRDEARVRVLEDLIQHGFLEKQEPHKLSVGTCQRCATVLEPRLSPQWFVKIEPLAKPAIEAVEQGRTRFYPESWTQTYFQWMRNIHDWCISRQLWWGHQIPAYYCQSCSPRQGDDADTSLEAPTMRVGGIDFARAEPLVCREPPTRCPRCGGGRFLQDPDVLDTWFSSALWPFSTLGWPRQTDELRTFYPNSVMETGHDIIFFWVCRMMMMGLHFMGEVPFKTVYLHAMVRDEKGEKMSKTKGNVIDPLDVVRGGPPEHLPAAVRNKFPQGLPAFGADALRFTLCSLTQQGRDIKLSLDRVAGYKAFVNKLWNAARFALMNMGDYRFAEVELRSRTLSLADRWILSRLQRTIEGTSGALSRLEFAEAASTLYQFLWRELCDWYIELAKTPLRGEDVGERDSTRAVLVYCLDRVLRLLHPFMPFITEELWQRLPMSRATESIVIAAYPAVEPAWLDEEAEAEMAPLIAVIEAVRSIRGETAVAPQAKVKVIIQTADAAARDVLERWRDYVMPLAGLSDLRVGPPGARPPLSAAAVQGALDVFVPLEGLIDLEEERRRLRKEIARAEADVGQLARKLDNPSFVARAPAEVVEKDRARLGELTARRDKLADNLNRIAPEGTMSQEQKPEVPPSKAPTADEASTIPNPETATVKIQGQVTGGGIDLPDELGDALAGMEPPEEVAPQVREALEKLREGTREGLSATDHHDLGMAYMSMGLVDDAVREFNEAKRGSDESAEEVTPPRGGAARKPRALARPAAAKAEAPKVARRAPASAKPAAVKAKPAAAKSKVAAKGKGAAAKGKPAAKAKPAAAKGKVAAKGKTSAAKGKAATAKGKAAAKTQAGAKAAKGKTRPAKGGGASKPARAAVSPKRKPAGGAAKAPARKASRPAKPAASKGRAGAKKAPASAKAKSGAAPRTPASAARLKMIKGRAKAAASAKAKAPSKKPTSRRR